MKTLQIVEAKLQNVAGESRRDRHKKKSWKQKVENSRKEAKEDGAKEVDTFSGCI